MVFSTMFARIGGTLLLSAKASVGASVIALFAMAESSAAACEFFSAPQRYNTSQAGEVMVIGHQPARPYRVVVFTADPNTLGEVRECVLDAFATQSRLGDYIQVASFERRGDAEIIGRVLNRSGYDSRVVYGR